MSSYNNTSIQDFVNQLDIVDVVGRVVSLKRAGANHKGVCPFHNEKTPSFVVSGEKQIFTCFGCGATGDVIAFTKRYYNLDFKEAVEKLSSEYGLEFKFSGGNNDYEKYYEVNREAAKFFYRAFTETKNPGYSYMKSRKIDDAILKKFGIGYADKEWDSLYKYFKQKGTDEKILLELGLIRKKDDRYYDNFRNRVIFPIINTSGKVIGFGGRRIDENDIPKYLNSPENKIFRKKNNLYALNLTKQDIGKAGYAIMVEGYMDVIGLYQSGITNVGASLGTALTENQAKLIKKYTHDVVLSYDADGAGQAAALRGIDILAKEDLNIKVLHVTDGKDPDEFVKVNGREAFKKLVDNSMTAVDYKINAAKRGIDINTDSGKIEFMKAVSLVLKNLSPIERDIYIKKVAQDYKFSEGALRMEIDGIKPERPKPEHRENTETLPQERLTPREATVLKVLFINPEFTEKVLPYQDIFVSGPGKRLINLCFELYGTKGSFTDSDIYDRLDPVESEIIKKEIDKIIIAGNEEEVFSECISNYEIERLELKQNEIITRLGIADEEEDSEVLDNLTKELMEIQRKISKHGGNV